MRLFIVKGLKTKHDKNIRANTFMSKQWKQEI